LTITLVGTAGATASSGSPVLTLPTGISFGDAAGFIGICSNANTLTPPAGYTVRSGWPKDGGSARFYTWVKDAVTASDSGTSVTFTHTGNKAVVACFVLHSGNGFPADWTDDLDFTGHAVTGTSYVTSSSTSTAAGDWGVAAFGIRGTGPFSDWTAASGLTERQDLTVSGSGAVGLHLCDSDGSIGAASTVWGPFTESNLSTSNGGGLTWLVKENATGGGGGGGGGGGTVFPRLGVWYARTGLSWPAAMAHAEDTYGPFQGHRSIYYPAGSLPIGTEVENAFDAGRDIHVFWKPWDSAGGSWADTDAGGYDTEIDAVAADVIALCSGTGRKIRLGLHHEPENDTTGASGNFSYAAYRGMWQQVRTRFDSAGASQYVTWVLSFMNSHTNPGNNPTGPGQNMIDLWGNDGVMDSLVDIVAQQDYIRDSADPATIATRWLEDLEFLVTHSTASRNWSYLDKPQAFTEWGADLGGTTADRGTNLHRAQTIDAIRGILADLASRNVVSVTYFDAITSSSASNGIDDPPSVDGVAFQTLKNASEAGQQAPPVTVAGVALARDNATGTSTSIPFVLPTGWQQGDYALAFLESNNLPTVSTVPTGWTLRDGPTDTVSANGRAWVYWKILQAGEPNPTWTISLSERPSGTMVLLRGVDATNPVHAVQPLAATATGTSHQVAAVATTATQAFVLTAWLARWADASGNGGVNYGTPPGTHTTDGTVSVNSGASAGSGGLVTHLTASPVAAGSHGPYTATFPVTCQGLVTQLALLPAGVQAAPQLTDAGAATDTLSVATGAVPKTLTDSGTATDAISIAAAQPAGQVVPTVTVQAAFDSQPMAATPLWTTLPDTGTGRVIAPLVVTHGRGDEFADVQPGTLSGALDNTDGRYTLGKTTGPHGTGVKVGRRVRVQLTYQGVVYPRFDGHANSWPTDWPVGGSQVAFSALSATDRLKRLGQVGELRSMLEEEILRDGPACYYPLSEGDGSAAAGSITPTPQASASDWPFGGGSGTVTFGEATGPGTDGLTAAVFAPQSQTSGRILRANPVTVDASGGQVTLECWFATTAAPTPNGMAMAALTTTAGDDAVILGIWLTGQVQAFVVGGGRGVFGNLSPVTYNDGHTHHAAVTLTRSGSTVTARLYVDGVQRQTGTYEAGPLGTFNQLDLGGYHVGANFAPYAGTLSHVAAHPTALAAARIQTHHQAGATGLVGERTDQRIARVADWVGLPAGDRALDVGDKLMGPQATAGKQPLEVMVEAARVEQGVLFVDGAGRLTFHRLSRRYNRTSPDLTLDCAAGHVSVPLPLPGDDFGVVNDMEVTRPGGATQRARNLISIDDYGLYRDSLEIPAASDTDAQAVANWRTGNYGDPRTRVPNLTVNLAKLHTIPGGPALVQQILALEISSLIRLTNLPTQAPGTSVDVFVEGWTETIDPAGGWAIELNCSPADHYTVAQLGLTATVTLPTARVAL
jgi:hypothetical protein